MAGSSDDENLESTKGNSECRRKCHCKPRKYRNYKKYKEQYVSKVIKKEPLPLAFPVQKNSLLPKIDDFVTAQHDKV